MKGSKNMKEYYGVVNTYDDKGKVNSSIISQRAEHKPENSFKETRKADIYIDWFDTYDEAEEFQAESLLA